MKNLFKRCTSLICIGLCSSLGGMQKEITPKKEANSSLLQQATTNVIQHLVEAQNLEKTQQSRGSTSQSDALSKNTAYIIQLLKDGEIKTAQAIAEIYKDRKDIYSVLQEIIEKAQSEQKKSAPHNKEILLACNKAEEQKREMYFGFSACAQSAQSIMNYHKSSFVDISRAVNNCGPNATLTAHREEQKILFLAWKQQLFRALNADEPDPVSALRQPAYAQPIETIIKCSINMTTENLQRCIDSVLLNGFELTDFLQKTSFVADLTNQERPLSALDVLAIMNKNLKQYIDIIQQHELPKTECLHTILPVIMHMPLLYEAVLKDAPEIIKASRQLLVYSPDPAHIIFQVFDNVFNNKLLDRVSEGGVKLPTENRLREQITSLGLTEFVEEMNVLPQLKDLDYPISALYIASIIERTTSEYVQNLETGRISKKEILRILDSTKKLLEPSLYDMLLPGIKTSQEPEEHSGNEQYEPEIQLLEIPIEAELKKKLTSLGFSDFAEKTDLITQLTALEQPIFFSDIALIIENATMEYIASYIKNYSNKDRIALIEQLAEAIHQKKSLLYQVLFSTKGERKTLQALQEVGLYKPRE